MMEKNRKKADKTEENRNGRVKLGTAAVVWVSAAVCAYLFFSFVITGATGFIGKALTEHLLENGYHVYAVGRQR